MRKRREKVEVQEPPIQGFKKKKSCLKRSCFSGCGCLVFFIIIPLLAFNFLSEPRPKNLKKLPEIFPENIPVYDEENIDKITYLSGKQKNKVIERAALLPKVILSPILLRIDKYTSSDQKGESNFDFENIKALISEPLEDYKNTLTIEWVDLTAEPKFIYDFYIKELEKEDYYIIINKDQKRERQLSFISKNAEGLLTITDDPSKQGTDRMVININIPVNK